MTNNAPYHEPMTVSAHDVAAELRRRQPGLDVMQAHKQLYYCQGHHLAIYGRPLFHETVSAWDHGPVVGELWHAEEHGKETPPPSELGEGELNTIGYVLSRYGGLSAWDLRLLTHAEDPWLRADSTRRPGGSVRIEREWMREYFATKGAPDADSPIALDSAQVREWLAGAPERAKTPRQVDDLNKLRAMAGRV